MAKTRKHTFSSWADAEAAYRAASKMGGILDIALRELVQGRVKWIEGDQPRKIGLCRMWEAHGGVVILVDRHMIGALYLDDWLARVQTQSAPPTSKDYTIEYKAWLDIRRLAAAAKTEQERAQERAAQEAHGCERIPIPQEVDQNIRTY